MELKGKQHKSVKRPKPNAVILHLKSAIKTHHQNLATVNAQLDHENGRCDFYVKCLNEELADKHYKVAKHTTRCKMAAEKRISNWESVKATLTIELRQYEKDLRDLRAAYGYMRDKKFVNMFDDHAYEQYKKCLDISHNIESRYSHVFGG